MPVGHPQKVQFLSTLPVRGATGRELQICNPFRKFLSTLPVRGATLLGKGDQLVGIGISIHAPREGSDLLGKGDQLVGIGISIHAPREGSDRRSRAPSAQPRDFYPRSP